MYKYSIAHAEDFISLEAPHEGIDNQAEGILALARANDNDEGNKFVLLRSDDNDTVSCLEDGEWVVYG